MGPVQTPAPVAEQGPFERRPNHHYGERVYGMVPMLGRLKKIPVNGATGIGITGCPAGTNHARPAAPRRNRAAAPSHRWAVILAGGDGSRLRSLTRFISGDDRPKQFCPIFSESTLLTQSCRRARKSIPAEQTLLAVTRAHEKYYLGELGRTRCHRLVQPSNKGTLPPIVYSLLQIAQADPDALVAILPCDHYYSDEDGFTQALESSFRIAGLHPESVVLMGAPPNRPEVEYGWIKLGAPLHDDVFRVRGFQEKPPLPVAERLLRSGALWNMFVLVGHIEVVLRMSQSAVPGLVEVFQSAISEPHAGCETRIPDGLYDWVSPSDFSKQVLSVAAEHLIALRLGEMDWHDVGHPDRVFATLRAANGQVPPWARRWQAARETAATSGLAIAG